MTTDRQTIEGLGSYQSDAIRNITGSFFGSVDESSGRGAFTTSWGNGRGGSGGGATATFNASRVVPIANENQVKNIALLPFIYYL